MSCTLMMALFGSFCKELCTKSHPKIIMFQGSNMCTNKVQRLEAFSTDCKRLFFCAKNKTKYSIYHILKPKPSVKVLSNYIA